VPNPSRPRIKPPPGAWDTHAHIFGPSDKFPYQPGRGYTPPDAPVERFIALLDHLGFSNSLVVQGNAHVFDNRVVLDALTRFPGRLRGVAITDARIKPEVLREWHDIGMRGLRFHLFPQRPNYIGGVGLDVFEVFRKTMAELGWVVHFFCDHRMLTEQRDHTAHGARGGASGSDHTPGDRPVQRDPGRGRSDHHVGGSAQIACDLLGALLRHRRRAHLLRT
jgi:2-pyrone-4,6-dicarboxylate lactonase